MSVRPCPKCQIPTARMLADSNRPAAIYYYHCERCGYIWSATSDFADQLVTGFPNRLDTSKRSTRSKKAS
jgi:hypothetical protein